MKRRKPHKTRWRCCPNTRSCDKSESGWPLIAPKHLLSPTETAVAVLRGIKGAQKRHEWLPLGPVWTEAVLARTQRVSSALSDWLVSTFLVISRVQSNFLFNFLFYSSSGERSKVYLTPREQWQCQKSVRRIPVSCMQLKVTSRASPANQAQVASPNTTPAIAVR